MPSREDGVSQSAASCSRFSSACPDPVCIGVGHPGFQNVNSSGEGPGVSAIPESGVKHKHSSGGRPLSVGRMFLKKAGQAGEELFLREGEVGLDPEGVAEIGASGEAPSKQEEPPEQRLRGGGWRWQGLAAVRASTGTWWRMRSEELELEG